MITVFSQTAVNFNCNDCNGNNHDLFTELDSGNVIVICWVMPCYGCIGPSVQTYNIIQGFESTHPGRVQMYVCDDEGTLNCPSLVSWCLSSGLLKTIRFSDTLIKMTDYGSSGMPKIVVLGGGSAHHVYYVANDSINETDLTNAIDAALLPYQGINENKFAFIQGKIVPNPSNELTELILEIQIPDRYNINLYDENGRYIFPVYKGNIDVGESRFKIDTSVLKQGKYFIQVNDTKRNSVFEIFVIK